MYPLNVRLLSYLVQSLERNGLTNRRRFQSAWCFVHVLGPKYMLCRAATNMSDIHQLFKDTEKVL